MFGADFGLSDNSGAAEESEFLLTGGFLWTGTIAGAAKPAIAKVKKNNTRLMRIFWT